MNIKMMNMMRGNKSIHPSILFCLSSSGWWWWNWVPWVESKRMKSHHSLQGHHLQTDSQSYFQTYGTYGQFRYHQLCKHACLWTAGRNGSAWREPTQAHGEHANLHRKAPNCFWIKKTGRHFLLKLSVSQIFILHKKPQTNAAFVITG